MWRAWRLLTWVTWGLGSMGCGETARVSASGRAAPTAQGGSGACAAEATVGCAGEGGSFGGGGGSSERHCVDETEVEAPTASIGCTVSTRTIDPMFTCGESDCAVKRVLDLSCETLPGSPSLSATHGGAVLLAVTRTESDADAVARLVRVFGDDASVQDVPQLADPILPLPTYSILNSALTADSNGTPWIFAGSAAPITALRETDGAWMRAQILPTAPPLGAAFLTGANVIDETLGYLTYTSQTDGYAPHLVKWDGSCWTDQAIGERSSPAGLVLAVDEKKQPWTAWIYESLYLRYPEGETEEVLPGIGTNDDRFAGFHPPLRLLPSGADAAEHPPLIAARVGKGLAVFVKNEGAESGWRSTLLPELDSLTTNCPFGNPMPASGDDPCSGVTSCDAEGSVTSSGIGLARTASGATFAAWVVYSSQGVYTTEKSCTRGELPYCSCTSNAAHGTGTADLVLMRLTETEPVLTHLRFDMGAPTVSAERSLVMTARGDTLLVAAQLGGINVPTLSYVEIDSSQLR